VTNHLIMITGGPGKKKESDNTEIRQGADRKINSQRKRLLRDKSARCGGMQEREGTYHAARKRADLKKEKGSLT